MVPASTWRCPACGFEPREVEGIRAFVAEADPEGAFSGEDYAHLEEVESASFWFRGRNAMVNFAIGACFPQAESLLEVGCGNGYVMAGVERRFAGLKLSGSELSLVALDVARDRLSDAALYQFDARSIPFRDEFDVVCAFDVLEHIDDDIAALTEMRAAVKSGGGLLVTVPQHRWLWSPPDDYAGHRRRYTRSELMGKLHTVGFKEILVTSFATAVLPLMAASRLRLRMSRGSYEPTREHHQARRLDALLDRLMQVDLALVRRGHSLCFGGSLLVAARS